VSDHPFRFVYSVGTPAEEVPAIVEQYDLLAGSFIRLFGIVDHELTRLLSAMADVPFPKGAFLMDSAGTGQKIGMFRKALKKQLPTEMRTHADEAASNLGRLNDFRTLLAHRAMIVSKGKPVLVRQGADLNKAFDFELDVSPEAMLKWIEEATLVVCQLRGIYHVNKDGNTSVYLERVEFYRDLSKRAVRIDTSR
jgi:hypothetical protein